MRKDLVYVGTYTRSGKCEGIYVYRRDPKHVRVVRVWRSERLLDVPVEDAP